MALLQATCRLLAYPFLWPVIHMPGRSHRGALPALSDEEGLIKDRLSSYVSALADEIGERNAGHYKALQQAERLIFDSLGADKYDVRTESFDFDGVAMQNVEAQWTGVEKPEEIVVVGAHYDTQYGTPGADDNATGVAAMLEIARRMKRRLSPRSATDKRSGPRRTIRFVGFANEENPGGGDWRLMGSYHYAKGCHERGEKIVGMVSLEMLGVYMDEPGSQQYPFPFNLLFPNTGNFLGFVGNLRSRSWVTKCIKLFRDHCRFPSEGVAAPEMFRDIHRSDHWSFWQFGYPGFMVTDTSNFRNKLYHTPYDTPDLIDFDRFARVTVGLGDMIEHLVND